MRLTWHRQTLRPKHRFATSLWATETKETIVLTLEHEGTIGHGEIVPSELYGQSLHSSEEALAGFEILLEDDPFAIEPTLARARAAFDDQRAAIDGLDAALHDWCGKRLGVPVWRLLGLAPARKQTTFTIGVAEPAEIREKVDEALAAGFDALKVKVGVDDDHRTLSYIRERFQGPLFLDANGAWTPAQALQAIPALAAYRPVLIEQPLAREYVSTEAPAAGANAGGKNLSRTPMAELRALGVAPIFADESCERPADVVRLQGQVDGINIKLNKCGGIREALRMIALARGFGMQVMLGCFVSSSLAIAPALTIASLVDYADLDGALLLGEDPFAGISRSGGVISLPDRPGLGVERSA